MATTSNAKVGSLEQAPSLTDINLASQRDIVKRKGLEKHRGGAFCPGPPRLCRQSGLGYCGGDGFMNGYIGALDQGTSSTRFLLFDRQGAQVAGRQLEHRQLYPRPGWVEHDPLEIWQKACAVIAGTLAEAKVPARMLPEVLPSIPGEPYGYTAEDGPFGARVPVAGFLGDQQAALFGQACFAAGESKNTYGTGCFLLLNTGRKRVASRHSLLTTVAWWREGEAPLFALEGSIAITGALVQWLRDNLGLIASSAEIEPLAAQVQDCGGVYFVPAFSGLFAPHCRADARGVIVGLSRFAGKAHLARAALEATAFQTLEVFQAMAKDSGIGIRVLKADGGMTGNELLMQFQADLLGVPVVRPRVRETTALGAAFAAGLSVGFWQPGQLEALWREDRRWLPAMGAAERERRCRLWRKAVERSLGWVE
jgi:glycerol kinase